MEKDTRGPGSDSDSDANEYDINFPRAQRARRRQNLRTRDPYPWRYFHLPRGTTGSNKRAIHEIESDSESERVRRDEIILRPAVAVSTGELENDGNLGLESQARDHLDTERENPSIAPHSCSYCSNVRLDLRTYVEIGKTTLDIPRLQFGAEKGCLLFSSLLRDVDDVLGDVPELPSDRIITNLSSSNIRFYSSIVGEIGHFDLYAVPGMSQCNASASPSSFLSLPGATPSTEFAHRQYPPNLAPNSQLSFDRLKGWLGECHFKHTTCRSFQIEYMPRRLLEVAGSTERTRVRLCTDPPIAPYTTLSYCWGRDQQSKTTRERLEQYRRDIPFRELSKTVQDAAKVTLGVGLKYLWVDALCIIQDDDEDKQEEISKMHLVYRGAFFTVAASSAASSYDGFLHPRVQYRPMKLAARTDDNVFTEVLLSPEYGGFVSSDPLFLRGWTFQETHLSTRIAAYGQREMIFCCLEDVHSDGGIDKPVATQAFTGALDPGNLRFGSLGHPDSWAHIISHYSRRSLSVESDKLLGIAALAEEYSLTKAVTDYLAGIWKEQFLLHCLWKVAPFRVKRPSTYVAPSWSWASVIGFISYPWTEKFSLSDIEILCILLDAETTLNSSYRFGMVSGGFMSIRARTRGLVWWKLDTDRIGSIPYGRATALTEFQSTDVPSGDAQIRCEVDIPTEWPANTYVPLVGVEICIVRNNVRNMDGIKAFGLVLERIDADSYRRVGWLTVYDADSHDYWFDDELGLAIWKDMLIK
ncbi:heterokaryon incompatibility protein-domain-containing protein [Xylaria telfairii]|nr:heterokaryon incompatibility protein-domain-containing protein [Xylaria telfairii]